MSDLWDFSSLFSSFHAKPFSNDLNIKYEQLSETMKNQLDQINIQLSDLEKDNIDNTPKFDLLMSPHQFPISPPTKSTLSAQIINKKNQSINLSSQKQKEFELHKIVAPPSTERITPRKHSRINGQSNYNVEQCIQNKVLNSLNTKTKYDSTRERLPPLKNNTTIPIKDNQIFKATPDEIRISNFVLSKEYKFRFTLQNISSHTHRFYIQGPDDPAFSFQIIEKINTSLIRPGLHITFEISFVPTELRDYSTSIIIISGETIGNANENLSLVYNNPNFYNNLNSINDHHQTIVKISCYREPPELELPDIVDLKSTLIHSSKSGSFTITNHGGVAFFCFKSLSGRDDSLIFTDGSFTLAPSQFQLAKEESIEISIKFRPRYTGKQSASFEIVPQHFSQRFYFIAKGNSITPNLKFKMGQDNKFLYVPFLPSDINTSKEIKIYNETDLFLSFHAQILKPKSSSKSILKNLYSDIDISGDNKDIDKPMPLLSNHPSNIPFKILPLSGQFSPNGTTKIIISFSPKTFGFFRANLVIFVDRIPDVTGNLGSKKMLTIKLEAYSGSPDIFIQPQLIIFNSVIPNVASNEILEIDNNSNMKIKLNLHHDKIIKPLKLENSLSLDLISHQKKTIELTYLMSKSFQSIFPPIAWTLFQKHPKTAKEFMIELRKYFIDQITKSDQNICPNNKSPSYAFSFKPNEDDFFKTSAEVINEENNKDNYSTNASLHNDNIYSFKNSYENKHKNFLVEESLIADEMPNIFALKKTNCFLKTNTSIKQKEKLMNEISLDIEDNQDINMKLDYLANISKPELIIEPPTLNFGFILAGESKNQILNLTNPYDCPIQYQIEIHPSEILDRNFNDGKYENEILEYSNDLNNIINNQNENKVIIEKHSGIINPNSHLSIEIYLNAERITKINRYITIKSWWKVSYINNIDISMPISEFDVKILACIDKPLLHFAKRIVDIGYVYPTLKYNAFFEGKLLNSFPTPFWVDDYTATISFERTINNKNRNMQNDQIVIEKINNRSKSVSETVRTVQNERSSTAIDQYNESENLVNTKFYDNKIEIQQSTLTEPKEGNLEIGSNIELNVSVNFAQLGDQAFPITVNIKGNKYTCAIVGHVIPPKITLLTEKIDFSDDFIICRRSESKISIKNECGIASSVRIEVNDDCHKVFQLHDITTHQILPNEIIEFPISCYSEVHGDFYGSFKLIIHDLWQSKEVIIPLHVKAQKSFFGFQTHTLGYTKWDNKACTNDEVYSIINSYKYGQITGIEELDFIYFGICSSKLTNAPTINSLNGKGYKVLRRLYIENYSSENIVINWSLVNLVKGRKYANVSLDVEDDGNVKLLIQETEEANLMEPFRILSEKTNVKPHDRSLIEVEFTIQEKPGIYRGILAAKCGEFTHELGLVAICE